MLYTTTPSVWICRYIEERFRAPHWIRNTSMKQQQRMRQRTSSCYYKKSWYIRCWHSSFAGRPGRFDLFFISTYRKSIQISKACLLARSCQIINVFEWSMCKDEHTSWSFTVLISSSCRCNRLGLKSFAYLWERDQRELLAEMADNGVQAILVKVAAMGLKPVHLGKTIAEMYPLLCELNEKYQSHVCGEGGEYETFTLDCPLFKKRIVV